MCRSGFDLCILIFDIERSAGPVSPSDHAGGVLDISRWQAPKARSHRIQRRHRFAPRQGCRSASATPAGVEFHIALFPGGCTPFGACHRLMSVTPPAWSDIYDRLPPQLLKLRLRGVVCGTSHFCRPWVTERLWPRIADCNRTPITRYTRCRARQPEDFLCCSF